MLDEYHDRLVESIAEHFGDSLDTVQAYMPEPLDSQSQGLIIDTPAALVEIEMLDETDDLGDGRDAVDCSVNIHCILGMATPDIQKALRSFAAEMLRLVKNNPIAQCRGLAGRPERISAVPGVFSKGEGGYDSFVVSFNQVVFLGEKWQGVDSEPLAVEFRRFGDVEQVI